MSALTVKAGNVEVTIEMADSETAKKILEAVPFESSVMTWGDEVYFETPVADELDGTAKEIMEVGEVGYWPSGNALAMFFGPTPASGGDEPRAASPVNVVGRIAGDPLVLKDVKGGDGIIVRGQDGG